MVFAELKCAHSNPIVLTAEILFYLTINVEVFIFALIQMVSNFTIAIGS